MSVPSACTASPAFAAGEAPRRGKRRREGGARRVERFGLDGRAIDMHVPARRGGLLSAMAFKMPPDAPIARRLLSPFPRASIT
jgi:hypothetical protein